MNSNAFLLTCSCTCFMYIKYALLPYKYVGYLQVTCKTQHFQYEFIISNFMENICNSCISMHKEGKRLHQNPRFFSLSSTKLITPSCQVFIHYFSDKYQSSFCFLIQVSFSLDPSTTIKKKITFGDKKENLCCGMVAAALNWQALPSVVVKAKLGSYS